MFKDKLNLLYVSDIGEFLPDYDTRYIVIPFSSDEFFIQLEPSLYLGKLKDIYEFICYDYDQLDINLQKKYKNNFKAFEKVQDNLYQMVVKNYTFESKKRNM